MDWNKFPDVHVGYKDKEEQQPEDVRLANGDPLYYVFLTGKKVAMGRIEPTDSQEAHARLRDLFAINKEAVLSCEGKTQEEALEILNAIKPLEKAA